MAGAEDGRCSPDWIWRSSGGSAPDQARAGCLDLTLCWYIMYIILINLLDRLMASLWTCRCWSFKAFNVCSKANEFITLNVLILAFVRLASAFKFLWDARIGDIGMLKSIVADVGAEPVERGARIRDQDVSRWGTTKILMDNSNAKLTNLRSQWSQRCKSQ